MILGMRTEGLQRDRRRRYSRSRKARKRSNRRVWSKLREIQTGYFSQLWDGFTTSRNLWRWKAQLLYTFTTCLNCKYFLKVLYYDHRQFSFSNTMFTRYFRLLSTLLMLTIFPDFLYHFKLIQIQIGQKLFSSSPPFSTSLQNYLVYNLLKFFGLICSAITISILAFDTGL